MTTIEEDFVSFETAKLLKEKGFDEPTIGTYYKDGTFEHLTINRWNSKFVTPISAPTLQMAMKWLREVHKIYIDINIRIILEQWAGYNVNIYKTNINNCLLSKFISLKDLKDNTSYEQACEAAINYCLKNLI